MEHDMHLPDDVDRGGLLAKIAAAAIPVVLIIGVAGYVIFGSGLM
ncbi:MAG TPA: hypothetical protein VJ798_04955 [Rhizomicrobium sp.]|nr:hypothetical protein [Rhizomicrobium sp.]